MPEHFRGNMAKRGAAVQAVRDLHENINGECAHCSKGRLYSVPWPCATIMATNVKAGGVLRQRFDTAAESLAARTIKDGDCLRWTGYRQPAGYGMIKVGTETPRYVHRVAYELARGPIPDGMQIDHLCKVRDCVNPDHLEAVTQVENLSRRTYEVVEMTHCAHGHSMTTENTYTWRNKRMCRTCMREQRKKRWVAPHERD